MLWLMLPELSWCPDPPCLIDEHKTPPRLDGLHSVQLNHIMNLTVVDWRSGEMLLCLCIFSKFEKACCLIGTFYWTMELLHAYQNFKRKITMNLIISLMTTALYAWLISLLASVVPGYNRFCILKKTAHGFYCICLEKSVVPLFHNNTLSQTNKARCENKTLIWLRNNKI